MAYTGGGAAAPAPRKKKKKNTRYNRNEDVTGGTLKRSKRRLKRTGPIKGVNTKDGIQGGEARKIERVKRRKREAGTLRAPHANGNGNGGQRNTPRRTADPLDRQVNAEANTIYAPQERQIADRRAQEQQFSTNLGGYYAQHQADMAAAQEKLMAYQTGVQNAAYGAAQNAATVDAGQNAQDVQKLQADAEKRGTTVDPQLLAQMQQGVAARQAMGNAGGDLIGAQGQANAAYGANQQVQAGQQGILAQQDSMNRQRKIDQLAQDLLSDKGNYKVKAKRDIQDTQHKQALEDAAFGIDTQNTLADNRRADRSERRQSKSDRALRRDRKLDNQRQNRSEDRQQRNTDSLIRDRQEDNARQERKDRAGLKGRGKSWADNDGDGIADKGKYRGYSESERDKFDSASDLLRRKKVTSKNAQQALAALIHDEHVPPRIAKRALRAYLRGKRKSVRPQTGTPVG